MRLPLFASVSIAALFANPAFAQGTSPAVTDDFHTSAIIITAPYVRGLDILGNISVVEGDQLARDLRGQIGESLTRQPGVSATSFSPGASRPVLRGFSGDRVRVLTDGIGSIDASNSSADHAVTIDPLTVERVEILRGPAVLLFGSQAIGGAVNLIDRRIPRAVPTDHAHIDAIAGYGTAAKDRSAGASIDVALTPNIVAHVDGSYRKADDVRTGGHIIARGLRGEMVHSAAHERADGHGEEADELIANANRRGRIADTASRTWTAAGGLALINEGGQLGISLSHYNSRYGVPSRPSFTDFHAAGHGHDDEAGHDHDHDDDHDGHTHGDVPVTIGLKQWRGDVRGELELGDGFFEKLRIRGGFADYKHTEYEGREIGTVFTNTGVEGRIELTQADKGGWRGASGVQYSHRDFNAVGAEAFVPRNLTEQMAVFSLQEFQTGAWGFEAAARYEHSRVRVPYTENARSFGGFSGALGANYALSQNMKLGLSLSRAVRGPSAEELYSNGAHIATQAFEIGNPNLRKETSWGAEANFRMKSENASLSLTAYSNWFDDFIYSDAIGEMEHGLPVFQYFQHDAHIWGFEAEANAKLAQLGGFALSVHGVADMTRAKIKGGVDQHAPRIPPLRLLGGIQLESSALTLRGEVEWTDDQKRISSYETATKGFTLVNASVDFRPLPNQENVTLSLQANNIFDVEARRHASFTKDYVPLSGRDFRIQLRATY